jgi:hypothetical protein
MRSNRNPNDEQPTNKEPEIRYPEDEPFEPRHCDIQVTKQDTYRSDKYVVSVNVYGELYLWRK